MRVEFRCKKSGNSVFFVNEVDIESMRKETEYEEVKKVTAEEKEVVDEQPTKQRGRPKKV